MDKLLNTIIEHRDLILGILFVINTLYIVIGWLKNGYPPLINVTGAIACLIVLSRIGEKP